MNVHSRLAPTVRSLDAFSRLFARCVLVELRTHHREGGLALLSLDTLPPHDEESLEVVVEPQAETDEGHAPREPSRDAQRALDHPRDAHRVSNGKAHALALRTRNETLQTVTTRPVYKAIKETDAE